MRNGQAYQRKTEKFFVYEEKKFGKIDSRKLFLFFSVLLKFICYSQLNINKDLSQVTSPIYTCVFHNALHF